MNLAALIRQVGEIGVRNGRLNSDVKDYINRAQRTIAERRNWTFMRDTVQVIVLANSNAGNLPGDFKELDDENSPISYTLANSNVPQPVAVLSRAEMNRRGILGPSIVANARYGTAPILQVFLEQNAGGVWTLNIATVSVSTSENATFTVNGYFYPDDLEKGDDQNAITQHGNLRECLIWGAKAIAYGSDPTDKNVEACNIEYERHMKLAIFADCSKATAGRALHM